MEVEAQLNKDWGAEGTFVLKKELGEGTFATVWEAVQTTPGGSVPVAVKVQTCSGDITRRRRHLGRWFLEVQALKELQSSEPNHILQYKGHWPETAPDPALSTSTVYIVTELLLGQELGYFLDDAGSNLTETEILEHLRQILTGVSEIHKRGWIHRDLKLENVCVVNSGERLYDVIIDFGFAMRQETAAKEGIRRDGNLEYTAPELDAGRPGEAINIDGRKLDVFACGVIFYILLFGDYPFGEDMGPQTDTDEIQRNKQELPPDLIGALEDSAEGGAGWVGFAGDAISAQTFRLLSKMLAADPDDRPQAAEALQELEAFSALGG